MSCLFIKTDQNINKVVETCKWLKQVIAETQFLMCKEYYIHHNACGTFTRSDSLNFNINECFF